MQKKVIVVRPRAPLATPLHGAALAVGNFDGVHPGHGALTARARACVGGAGKVGVVTFHPHPQAFFAPTAPPRVLTGLREKCRLLGEMGVDFVVVERFDRAMATCHAQDFVEQELVGRLAAGWLVTGEDFRFGKGREGDVALLQTYARAGKVQVAVVDEVANGERYSSSRARAVVREGNMEEAAKVLGHIWSMSGRVRRGDGRGHTLGFATANLSWQAWRVVPRFGVYAVRVRLPDGEMQDGVASFGVRPTFGGDVSPALEVHLHEWHGARPLYGERLEVGFVSFLREEKKFADGQALVEQMHQDVVQAKAHLGRNAHLLLKPIGIQ